MREDDAGGSKVEIANTTLPTKPVSLIASTLPSWTAGQQDSRTARDETLRS